MTRRVSPRERDVLLQTLARSKATLLARRIMVVREMRALTRQLEQTDRHLDDIDQTESRLIGDVTLRRWAGVILALRRSQDRRIGCRRPHRRAAFGSNARDSRVVCDSPREVGQLAPGRPQCRSVREPGLPWCSSSIDAVERYLTCMAAHDWDELAATIADGGLI